MGVGPNIQHLLGGSPESQVDEKEDDADDEADAANHDVGDTKEGILAAQDAGGGNNDRLGAGKISHWVIVTNLQLILILGGQTFLKI